MEADQPTTLLRQAASGEHQILGEGYTDDAGEPCVRPLRQVVVRADKQLVPVPWPRAWNAAQLRTALERRGLAGSDLVECYLEDDENLESKQNRRMLTDVFGGFSDVAVYGGRGDREVRPVALRAGISRRYIRGLAKVAFHYFLWACPILRGNELCFADVRAFICDDEGDWQKFVGLNAEQFLPQLREGVPAWTSHFFHYRLRKEEILAWVQFFSGPDRVPPTRVVLARNPSLRFDELKSFRCHQASYCRVDGHDGEIAPIEVWEKRVVIS